MMSSFLLLLLVTAASAVTLDSNGCPADNVYKNITLTYQLGEDGNCYRSKPALNFVSSSVLEYLQWPGQLMAVQRMVSGFS